MSHSTDDSRPAVSSAGKPTLEALLRLKRAERPDAAFWDEFERGLRQKQLAAIVEPKPWWLGLALLGRRLAPAGLPVSAAAAAVIAVMVLRTQAPFSFVSAPAEFGAVPMAGTQPKEILGAARLIASAPLAPDASGSVSPIVEHTSINDSGVSVSPPVPVPAAERTVAYAPISEPQVPVVASLLEITPPNAGVPTASEVTIAQNLAAVRAEDPQLLASATRLEPGTELSVSDDPVIEPALKMEVRNPRHARVLLAMAENSSIEAVGGVTHLRERVARSLDNDDALFGSSSRLGVGGDRLSLRF